jgi:hypothetical protein
LVIATAFYAYYTKHQVKLLKVGHGLTKKDIAVKALAAYGSSSTYITKAQIDEKLKELELDKA